MSAVKYSIHISFIIIFSLALVFCLAGTAYAASQGTVNDNGVNVRKGSSTSATVITQVSKGQNVTITGTEGDFYHVYFPGVDDGYISKQFVTVKDSAQSPAASAAPAAPAASQSTGKVNGSNVNIRSKPSTDGEVLGKAKDGDTYSIKGTQAGWVQIVYNNREAYISSEFIQVGAASSAGSTNNTSNTNNTSSASNASSAVVENPPPAATPVATTTTPESEQAETIYAIVTSDTGLYMRQLPMIDSAALNTLTFGDVVDVTSIDSEWIGVTYEGLHGYVSAEFVIVERGIKPSVANVYEEAGPLAAQIIEYAKQFLGTPYVYGGTSLTKGVDCSGFVYAVMKEFGISLNRASYEMAKNGVTVQRSQLKPGDLIFFDTDGRGGISHVGIYIGNKKFIHSSSSKRNWGVTISSLDEATYNRQFKTANRVI